MLDSFPCPKCSRSLARSGEVEIGDAIFPVFQCDDCIIEVGMFGEIAEIAYTFAVDAAGTPFDPASEEDQHSN